MTDETRLSDELEAINRLTAEIVGLRADVRDERRGRRLSIVAVCVALLVGGFIINTERVNRENQVRSDRVRSAQEQATACQARIDGRADVRKAIIATANRLAVEFHQSPSQRHVIADEVTLAVAATLPTPTC